MKVKVEFTVETADYRKPAFRREIEKLIESIDPETKLLSFDMYQVKEKI